MTRSGFVKGLSCFVAPVERYTMDYTEWSTVLGAYQVVVDVSQ